MWDRNHFRNGLALRTRVLAPLRDRVNQRTSYSDITSYTTFCARAASDPSTFATFKQSPDYTAILEHVTCAQGAEYLAHVLERSPEKAALLDRFRENDRLGTPRTCHYGPCGRFSPTTLRYVKVLTDLQELFGHLEGSNILEIGGGYGGQCFVTSVAFTADSYTIVDLEPCLTLQEAYLRRLGVPNVRFVSAKALDPRAHYDLVVSNYAFSECVRSVQQYYLARALQRSSCGYVTCNWMSPPHYRSLGREDLLSAIPGSHFLAEMPLTGPGNALWVWGDE